MREIPNSSPDDDIIDDLDPEQRALRKQRVRKEANIAVLKQELENLKNESREKIPILERLSKLGARAYIWTELSKLESDLREIAKREESCAGRYTYIAPLDPFVFDDTK